MFEKTEEFLGKEIFGMPRALLLLISLIAVVGVVSIATLMNHESLIDSGKIIGGLQDLAPRGIYTITEKRSDGIFLVSNPRENMENAQIAGLPGYLEVGDKFSNVSFVGWIKVVPPLGMNYGKRKIVALPAKSIIMMLLACCLLLFVLISMIMLCC